MKGQSIMDNPEKLATLNTLDIGRRKTKSQQNTERCAPLTPPKSGVNPDTREGQAVPASYKTTFLLLI
jgi:hypothetical protein